MTYPIPTIKNSSKPSQYQRAVAFCVDRGFLPYASYVAHQILEKEEHRDFDIVICIPHTESLPKEQNPNIRYCAIDYSHILNLPVGRLSMATYYKIFLPAIFGNTYEQILYLDADVYVKTSCISSLMDNHKENTGLVMAVDISEIERKSGLKFHNSYLDHYAAVNHQYSNAGVILFNTTRLLEIGYLNQLMGYAENNLEKLVRHDQTLINTVLYNEISSLSFLFNYQLIDTTIPFLEEFEPKILHFVGELKPWNTAHGFAGKLHDEYKSFIQQHFPNHKIEANSEFKLKYESRKKKRKYTIPLREQLSLKIFIGKEKLKRSISFFQKSTNTEARKRHKNRKILPNFRVTIRSYICE
ncbi:glycosyltransferase family 8 protein [Belliella marina]|uniref:Glycosyltransferase family 8 protein n=1 Tax=Belliella marina TaxID=1644146 RepID=A0ABW4VQK3_9BACT